MDVFFFFYVGWKINRQGKVVLDVFGLNLAESQVFFPLC